MNRRHIAGILAAFAFGEVLALVMNNRPLVASIIQAVIPAVVPTANKIGNSSKFQLGASGAIAGDCAQYDANLNVTGAGTGAGCGTAGPTGGGLFGYSGLAGIALTGTIYFPAVGGATASTTEAAVATVIESDTDFSRLGVSLDSALGMGNSAVITVRKNAADTAITCTISGAVTTFCGDVAHSFHAVPDDTIDYSVALTGTIVVSPRFKIIMQSGTLLTSSFSAITAGTNTAALLMGAGGTLGTTSTGVLTSNAARIYTVSTLPAAAGSINLAFVSDGATTSDCTSGSGSLRVLCASNGSVWQAVGSGGSGGATVTTSTFAGLPSCTSSNINTTYLLTNSWYAYAFCNGSAYSYFRNGQKLVPPVVAASFTNVNTGAATVDTTRGPTIWLNMPGDSSFSVKASVIAKPGGTWHAIVGFIAAISNNTNSLGGIMVRDSGSSKEAILGLFQNGNGLMGIVGFTMTNSTTNSGTFFNGATGEYFGGPPGSQIMWLRVGDNGANRTWDYSLDYTPATGVGTWQNVKTEASGTFLTEDQVGFFLNGATQGAIFLHWETTS